MNTNEPKIVFWDLETLHDPKQVMKAENLFQIGNWPGRTLSPDLGSIICFGYKILGQKKADCVSAWDFENWKEDVNDDSAVCMMAYEILKDADVLVTHNGKKYDMPYLNNRLMKNGFPPLHKITHVDTKVVSKRIKPYSASLNALAKQFNLEQKMENGGAGLWDKVRERNLKGQKTMTDYCKQDVEVLEQLYLKLRPLLKNSETANFSIRKQGKSCNTCGSHDIISHGQYMRKTGIRQRYICKNCGSTMSEKINKPGNMTTESV